MTQFPDSSPPPPMFPGEMPQEPKSWPKVLGIFSIVWGSLGLICNGCGAVMLVFQQAMMDMLIQQQQNNPSASKGGPQMTPMPDVMKPGAMDMAGPVLGFLVCILLLVAGILLTMRRAQSRMMHLVYGGLSLIVTLIGTAMAVQKQNAIAAWATQNPDDFWAIQQTTQGGQFAYIGIGRAFTPGLAYTVFVLIWFGVIKRNTTEITTVVEEPII